MAIKISDITYDRLNQITPIKNHTPFGFYDNDPEFIKDSKKLVSYVAQRMGVSELTKPNLYITDLTVYAAYEEAVTTYGNTVYEFKVRDNYLNIEGSSTNPFIGSSDSIQSSKDINVKVNWSSPINATLKDVDNNIELKSLIDNNKLWKIKAPLDNFILPNLKYIQSFNLALQKVLPEDVFIDLSNIVLNQYNKLVVEYLDKNNDPQTKFVSSIEEGETFIEEIGNGLIFIYFIITDNQFDFTDVARFPDGVDTIYKQKINPNELNGRLLNSNLTPLIDIADSYGQEIRLGGNIDIKKGKLEVKAGQQIYDLQKWAKDNNILLNSQDQIEIYKVFHDVPPALVRFFDPFAMTGMGMDNMMNEFGMGGDSPAASFFMFPINFDLQRIQQIELNDEIRRSSYSFNITNNKLELFPIPSHDYNLFFEYNLRSDRDSLLQDQPNNIVTDITNIPFENPVYSNINPLGRQWIFKYTLAICKEVEGHVRIQHSNISLPKVGTPQGSELLNDAKEEKTKLLDQLKETLGKVSKVEQLKQKSEESNALKDTLENIPNMIYIG